MAKKTKPTREQIVAKQLFKQSQQNKELRKKEIGNTFWKLFEK